MRALIVESATELAQLWQRHLERAGIETRLATGQTDAVAHLQQTTFDILILDLVLTEGSAIAIADFANYKQPHARVISVTNTSFFSDGSIFQHLPNACAFVQSDAPPDDLLAMVEHYGRVAS
ncbi:VpsR-related response regulator [Rhodobacteraceae bacterium D3-12]|nr:VpsR-related response regulator [Rhodobacteraceae bacterium D3-12]